MRPLQPPGIYGYALATYIHFPELKAHDFHQLIKRAGIQESLRILHETFSPITEKIVQQRWQGLVNECNSGPILNIFIWSSNMDMKLDLTNGDIVLS